MSTIIDALKQAERESKNILSDEEDTPYESLDSDSEEELEEEKFEEEKKSFLSNKFALLLIFLAAFIGAGSGGWYLYGINETGPFLNKKISPVSSKIKTAPISYNVNEKNKVRAILPNNVIKDKNLVRTVSLAIKTKNYTNNIIKKSNLTKVAFAENEKGVLFYGKKELEKARDEFIRAIKNEPDMTEAHFNLALVYEDIGKISDAESEYKKVMSLDNKFVDAYINLGVIYNNQKRYSEAQKIYEDVLEISPDDSTAHFNLGVLYAYYIKEPIKAIFHWKRYIRIEPKSGNIAVIKKEIAKLSST